MTYRHGNTFRAHGQFMRAAAQYDNAHDWDRENAEARDEEIDALLADDSWRAARVTEADEWCDGTFEGEHYSAVERALADLADVPAERLIGSDALATVLRLARVHADARERQLRVLAEREVDDVQQRGDA